jgi:adenine-specific DNA methylase
MKNFPKRLIEVDLPIKRISEHARREKSIRHGHISTLHLWWARRPLAACRAVICAALWPDPVDDNCPQEFRDRAVEIITRFATKAAKSKDLADHCSPENIIKWMGLTKPENRLDSTNTAHLLSLRVALLDFIADFANWDSSTVIGYLETSRELTQAAHEALGGERGTRPLVEDPFAGGGSIPLEALRVGADAFASDINPIPILLNKILIEYIPKYGQSLADEVRKWGEWVKREAEKELSEYYPKDPNGATPIAYLWARTIKCEGPGCGVEVPLMRSLWLINKSGRSVALQLIPNQKAKRIDFQIIVKQQNGWIEQGNPKNKITKPSLEGTIKRGSATCPYCGFTTPVARIREQLKSRFGGARDARLYAVITTTENEQGRTCRLPSEHDYRPLSKAEIALNTKEELNRGKLSLIPNETLPLMSGVFNAPIYGHTTWGSLFTARQALTLSSLVELVKKAQCEIEKTLDPGLSQAVGVILALAVSRLADISNSLCNWSINATQAVHLFGRQAIPMMWDFAETSLLSEAAGDIGTTIRNMLRILESKVVMQTTGQTLQANAAEHPLPDDTSSLFFTDPPYYNAVPYADLSDFFYVWLHRMLGERFSTLFAEDFSPKANEICEMAGWDPVRYPHKDKSFFETKMADAMREGRRILKPNGLGVVVFAHKSTNGWEAQLQAMVDAGWIVTASWAIDTERETRLRAQNSAALASSVHLVCRPRENLDGSIRTGDVGDWRDVLNELPKRIHDWMPRLAQEGVVGADAIFACLGPALEIFSRYSKVEKTNGEQVTLKEYLIEVWAAVSREALKMIFEGADASGFEEDARLTAIWLWTLKTEKDSNDKSKDEEDEVEDNDDLEESGKKTKTAGGFSLEYDAARKISQGLGVHLDVLKNLVEVKGDTARLQSVAERSKYLFGKESTIENTAKKKKQKQIQTDLFAQMELPSEAELETFKLENENQSSARTTLDRVHQTMLLFAAGRSDALKRFLVDDGVGRNAHYWRLAQSLSMLYPTGTDEKRWVDGVLARKKGLGL